MSQERKVNPPGLLISFMEFFCPDELVEGLLCDFEEQFYQDLKSKGRIKSNVRFAWNVVRLLHPQILSRKQFFKRSKFIFMFKSHFIVTQRNVIRNKFYSFINVLGLSLAIALVVLGVLFAESEFSKDQFHVNKDKVYRIYTEKIKKKSQEVQFVTATTSIPMSKNVRAEFDQIARYTRFGSNSGTVTVNNTHYDESVHFTDPDFFKMFSFPVISGNLESPLKELNDMVLSPEMALKYFGDEDPIGQTIKVSFNNQKQDFIVSAVVDPKAGESSILFDIVLHIEQFKVVVGEETFNSEVYRMLDNFVQLQEGVSSTDLEPLLSRSYNRSFENEDVRFNVRLQGLTSMYLDTYVPASMAERGDPVNVYILIGLILLVLLIAVINFVTLSTSQAMKRIKEIGVRKAIGAGRGHLREQLIVEAFLITFFSALAGVTLAFVALPYFNDLSESRLGFDFSLVQVAILIGVVCLVAIISGVMQSGLLVTIRATEALRGKLLNNKTKTGLFNKALMTLQFTLSIALIVGTVIMRSQLHFVSEKNLGYNQERLIQISTNSPEDREASQRLLNRFRTEMQEDPNVLSVTGTMNDSEEPWTIMVFPQEDGSREPVYFNQIDPDYLETMGIDLAEGRDFNRSSGDAMMKEILVNEALVEHFGLTDPLNQQIPGKHFTSRHKIIGVVKDFHFADLKQEVKPLILAISSGAVSSGSRGLNTYRWPPMFNKIMLRAGPGDIMPGIDKMEETWAEINPGHPFLMRFVDDVLETQYEAETRWQKIIDSASVLAILIAWLGLLGLTRLSVQRKIKEIGIRKVLGSSVTQVVYLLSRNVLGLIILANLIAWPIVWWLAEGWLADFAYRIKLNILLFVVVGLAILIFALCSVIWQVMNAAMANPVKSLRYE